jgi:hypothetical protein
LGGIGIKQKTHFLWVHLAIRSSSFSPEELARKLKPLGEEERHVILKLKKEECQKRGLPFKGELYAWDTRYFMTQVGHR